jgi:hypothetical protein
VSQAREKLLLASKRLVADWQQLKELWRDQACQQFEQAYMVQIQSEVQACLMAMEIAQQALSAALVDTADRMGQ